VDFAALLAGDWVSAGGAARGARTSNHHQAAAAAMAMVIPLMTSPFLIVAELMAAA
jgi:hypothetical protein